MVEGNRLDERRAERGHIKKRARSRPPRHETICAFELPHRLRRRPTHAASSSVGQRSSPSRAISAR
jgi:hypothetical protein